MCVCVFENTAHVWLWGTLTEADGGGGRPVMNGSWVKRRRKEEEGIYLKRRETGRKKKGAHAEKYIKEAPVTAQNKLNYWCFRETRGWIKQCRKETLSYSSSEKKKGWESEGRTYQRGKEKNEECRARQKQKQPKTWRIYLGTASSILHLHHFIPLLLPVVHPAGNKCSESISSETPRTNEEIEWLGLSSQHQQHL